MRSLTGRCFCWLTDSHTLTRDTAHCHSTCSAGTALPLTPISDSSLQTNRKLFYRSWPGSWPLLLVYRAVAVPHRPRAGQAASNGLSACCQASFKRLLVFAMASREAFWISWLRNRPCSAKPFSGCSARSSSNTCSVKEFWLHRACSCLCVAAA